MKQLDVFNASFKGLSLVEASAGTGKTYNITSLYIRAVLEKNLQPSQILVLTYTEAATTELKSRVRSRIKEAIEFLKTDRNSEDDFLENLNLKYGQNAIQVLEQALFSFDEASILTIHGFCQKLLREESFSFGVQPDFEILKDSSEIMQDAIDSFWRKEVEIYSSTDQGKGILEFLLSIKLTPENIKPVIEKVLSKPYAKVYPEKSLENEAELIINRIQKLNDEIKKQWRNDNDQLYKVIFSGKLNKRSYKKETFEEIWKNLEKWITRSETNFTGFTKLENFGEQKLSNSVNKGNQIIIPEISKLIDQFLEELTSLSILKIRFLKRAMAQVREEIEDRKERINSLSFDDLLQKVSDNLDQKLALKISKKYPVALVDEFQDTDPIQYSIFKKIYSNKGSGLFMIGDPKQAIYSFRGADLFTYFEATRDVKPEQHYSLNFNFRSSKRMISAVNSVFSRFEKPFVFEMPKFRNVEYPEQNKDLEFYFNGKKEAPLSFVDCIADEETKENSRKLISSYVAKQVKQLLNNNYQIGHSKIKPNDISILVRTKAEGNLVADSLRESGIKSISRSNQSVFQTKECSDLRIILKAINENTNHDLIRAALTTSYFGFSADKILSLFDNEEEWVELIESFRNAKEEWERLGILKAIGSLNHLYNIRRQLSDLHNAERRLTNFDHLLELLSIIEKEQNTAPSSLIRVLNQRMESTNTPADEEVIRLESDSDLVSITTLHSSKGLEYPIVFIPFLWDEFERNNNKGVSVLEFHDDANELNIDLNPGDDPDKILQSRKESLADSLRLTYVAITRAKVACFIPFISSKWVPNSPLFALLSGTEETLNTTGKDEDMLGLMYKDLRSLNEKEFIRLVTDSEVLDVPEGSNGKSSQTDLFEQNLLNSKQLNRTDLANFSRVTSFSSLTSSYNNDETDKDFNELSFEIREESENFSEEEVLTRFNFPKGSNTGNLLHNIFEYIDFEDNQNHLEIIKKQCLELGVEEKWLEVLRTWTEQTLIHNLKDKISLRDLGNKDVLKEMEFHFPISEVSPDKIFQIVRENNITQDALKPISGFMKGFIDLVFRYENKYYILDYKSNYLGEKINDYNIEALKEKITSSNFDIQYHIYTLALKLYLEKRIPGFDYKNDFGGVFYLFLRGIDSTKEYSGVFFDRPSLEKVQRLEEIVGGKLHE